MPWFGALKLILFLTDLRRRKAYPLCNCYIMSIKENSSVACHGKYSLKFSVTSFFLYNFRSYNELARNDTWQEFDTCRFRS